MPCPAPFSGCVSNHVRRSGRRFPAYFADVREGRLQRPRLSFPNTYRKPAFRQILEGIRGTSTRWPKSGTNRSSPPLAMTSVEKHHSFHHGQSTRSRTVAHGALCQNAINGVATKMALFDHPIHSIKDSGPPQRKITFSPQWALHIDDGMLTDEECTKFCVAPREPEMHGLFEKPLSKF